MFKSDKLLSVTIIYNKANTFGLEKDAQLIKRALSGYATIRFADPLEHPVVQDINIHLEVPIYSYVPWASYNIFMMNPECYFKESWDPYMKHFDLVITKEDLKIEGAKVLPWSMLPMEKPKNITPVKEFLYLLGGSKNKREFAKHFLPLWKESYPTIHVYSVEPLTITQELANNVKFYVEDLTNQKRNELLHTYSGHVCCSMAEGFGYTAAEANSVNAFTILNTLPVYLQDYKNSSNKAWLTTKLSHSNEKCPYGSYVANIDSVEVDLEKAISEFSTFNYIYKQVDTFKRFQTKFIDIMNDIPSKNKIKALAPVLDRNACPRITVITLIYNRRKFFDLARHNMILTDYPKDKIEWVIVDDSDDINEQASDLIIQTQNTFTGMDIRYVPLLKKTPIAQKRNIGVENSSNDIILFMDDDDHYPETSFRRRVAWLTKHPLLKGSIKAVACTTIACYDLIKGVSAVNSPPFDIPLGQRISEATLTFYKDWFQSQKFDKLIQVGEGESLVKGREHEVLEIPPQQIIVAFSHGKNTSDRRIPSADGVEPSCFWGFPKEYLVFIHGLAGIKVV